MIFAEARDRRSPPRQISSDICDKNALIFVILFLLHFSTKFNYGISLLIFSIFLLSNIKSDIP